MLPKALLQPDDTYLAALLTEDANAANRGSHLNKRRSDAPRPNTRFLRQVLKGAEGHNAALAAREGEERRVRQIGVGDEVGRARGKDKVVVGDAVGKRRREDGREREESGKRRREERVGRWHSVLGLKLEGRRESGSGLGRSAGGERTRSGHVDDTQRRHSSQWESGRQRHELRDALPSDSRSLHSRPKGSDTEHRKKRRRHDQSPRQPAPSHKKSRVINPPVDGPSRSASPPATSPNRTEDHCSASGSDPLSPFLGPPPPPATLPRGRGALSSHSNIDARFNDPQHDPCTDVGPDPNDERDDWSLALEALRDRQSWRQKGAKRLREAGFGDREVEEWERSMQLPQREAGAEKDVRDVRWRGKGEGREWDAGKVVGEGGLVNGKAEWTRVIGR